MRLCGASSPFIIKFDEVKRAYRSRNFLLQVILQDCYLLPPSSSIGLIVMRIKRLEVANFRALRDTVLNFEEATALIGENNCGKSAFLLALDLFFASSPRVGDRDFSDGKAIHAGVAPDVGA